MHTTIQNLYPRLRAIDVRPISHEGQFYFLLRDPSQLSEAQLLVPQILAPVLACCDGTQDIDAMRQTFVQQYGFPIAVKQIGDLISTLDEALFLENERTEMARMAAHEEYRQAPFRPPALAGSGYPALPYELSHFLDGYLKPVVQNNGHALNGKSSHNIRGILSPHIDYTRGGRVYAHAWHEMRDSLEDIDLVIMFGTDHYGNDPFTLTRQHYATPYGILPTAVDVVDGLANAIGEEDAFVGELRHRGEHSLELVAVWLHHMLQKAGRTNGCELVPILCGSFYNFIEEQTDPTQDLLLNRVLDSLKTTTAGRNVLVVASGDLAHVGPAFNGPSLDHEGRQQLQAADEELVDRMCIGDTAGFFEAIRRVEDSNNVCGVTPIYLTMRMLEANGRKVSGQQMAYAVCPADEQDTSVVTVSGIVFR